MRIVCLAILATVVALAKSTPALDLPKAENVESRLWSNCVYATEKRWAAYCTGKYGDTGLGECPSPYCKRKTSSGGNGNSGGSGRCKDQRSDCAKYTFACKGSANAWFYNKCKKTCGLCSGGGSNPSRPPRPPTRPPNNNNNNNNEDCGRKPARIVGGTEATAYSIPWQVGLVSRGRDKPWCGGTLIGDRHVLTAAHCTQGSSLPDVIVGEHKTTSSSDGTRHEVCRIVNHPSYSKSSQNNDFSILRLKKPVQFGRRAAPACLPTSRMRGEFLTGKSMTVSGWGTTSSGGSTSSVLRKVNVPGVSNAKCSKSYRSITDHMLCAGQPNGGVDSCQGDSGGPLTYTTGGRTYLVGVVSYGIGCAKPGYPGVYARVTEEMDWINSELKKTC